MTEKACLMQHVYKKASGWPKTYRLLYDHNMTPIRMDHIVGVNLVETVSPHSYRVSCLVPGLAYEKRFEDRLEAIRCFNTVISWDYVTQRRLKGAGFTKTGDT